MAVNEIPNLQFNNQSNLSTNQNQYVQNNRLMGNSLYPSQSIFMQPIGNIYGLGNSSEIGNVPVGNNVSAGLCLSEGVLYLKTMQTNGPAILGYKLTPLELVQQQSQMQAAPMSVTPPAEVQESTTLAKIEQLLQNYDSKITQLGIEVSNLQKQLQGEKGGGKKWEV